MSTPSIAALPLDPQQALGAQLPSQNLFEHAVEQARGLPVGASPSQLAHDLLQGMNGFLERTMRLSPGVPASADAAFAPPGATATDGVPKSSEPGRHADGAPLADGQIQRMIDQLAEVLRHSTEVAMVVRNTSGASTSVNTLLRGQ